MRNLKTVKPPERKSMDKSLLMAIRMSDVVDQLGINYLLVKVAVDYPVRTDDAAAVRRRELFLWVGLNTEIVLDQCV